MGRLVMIAQRFHSAPSAYFPAAQDVVYFDFKCQHL